LWPLGAYVIEPPNRGSLIAVLNTGIDDAASAHETTTTVKAQQSGIQVACCLYRVFRVFGSYHKTQNPKSRTSVVGLSVIMHDQAVNMA
jgi:hypothetical protein